MQMQSPIAVQSAQQPRFYTPKYQGSYQKTNNFYNSGPQFRPSAPPGAQNVGGPPGGAGGGGGGGGGNSGVEFDGKRLRKAVIRKTIDYNSAIVKQLELRVWQRDHRDYRAIQPDTAYAPEMPPPPYLVYNPINAVTTKFVRTSTNKMRCPIFCVAWTPEGRRLVTGASSGEFTLWNGLTFNFETILQAHDSPVRCMVWSHNDQWMVTGDHAGFVKYWQSNMNNVKMFQAHKEPLRGISFCPTDHKFATCSDDGTVRIWDFARCHEERILRGHGADVKCLAWHPHKGLLVSGSKDSQQPIKLWDPKSGQSLATLHAHKSTVMEAKWNENGNWLITGSRDHLIKLFDIRKLSQEVQTFRGHKKEVSCLAWHPVHESLFASGGSDGAVMFWLTGVDKEVGSMEQAHDSIVWALAWHPLGHILCSGSNDHTCKFWTRNRPGDKMRDKYNLNIMTSGNPEDAAEYDDINSAPSIPGMGLDHQLASIKTEPQEQELDAAIPGLDFGSEEPSSGMDSKMFSMKKVPYAKPIPRQFQQQWMDNKRPLLVAPPPGAPPNPSNLPPIGNKDSVPPPSASPAMPQPPSQGLPGMMPPPPHAGIPNFPPPTHMMPPSDQQGVPRMPPPSSGSMMWPPPGPPGAVGNGNQFMPPASHPTSNNAGGGQFSSGGATGNNNSVAGQRSGDFPGSKEGADPKWKDFGDNDFRLQMDSDMRMMGGPPSMPEGRDFSSDQDMRARMMMDTDARLPPFNNNNFPPPGAPMGDGMMMTKDRGGGGGGGRPPRSASARWGPGGPSGGMDRGQFHPGGPEGDWDERMGPPPPMQDGGSDGPRKRPWEEGPGGGGGGYHDDEHFGGPGMMGGPPHHLQHHHHPMANRGGPPPPWMRGRGGRMGRMGQFRGGSRGGRGGSWEH